MSDKPPRPSMQNTEAKARVRTARYLLHQIQRMGLTHAQIAKDVGTTKDRIGKIGKVTPQSHVLQRIGASVERFAKQRYASAS